MNNVIIKNFSINPESGYIVLLDDGYIYISMLLSKLDLQIKEAKFVKICFVKASHFENTQSNESGYEKSYIQNVNRNSKVLKQFLYNDYPISIDNSEEKYQTFTFKIPFYTILDSLESEIESHILKIYFLDEKKKNC